MARFLSWIVWASIVAFQLLGCQDGKVSKKVVERAMSGEAGINVEQHQVEAVGEPAIPVIFEVLRDHSDEQLYDVHFTDAQMIIIGMVSMGTADPSAPYIRKVLADQKESEKVRITAAEMLVGFDKSPEPRRALIDRIKHDTSEEVRVMCIGSLGGITVHKFCRSKTWHVDPDVQQTFSLTIKDKSAKIRKQTCDSVAGIASETLYEGVELAWCRRLLIQGKHDKEYVVRKAAVDDLFVLDSIRQKNRHR
jgi:hypothetical protein